MTKASTFKRLIGNIAKGVRPEPDCTKLGFPPVLEQGVAESEGAFEARAAKVAEERREAARALGCDDRQLFPIMMVYMSDRGSENPLR